MKPPFLPAAVGTLSASTSPQRSHGPRRRLPAHLGARLSLGLSLLFLLTVATGCETLVGPGNGDTDPPPPAITQLPRDLSGAEEEAIRQGNAFGFRLLSELAGADPNGTIFISPLSASMALGLTLTGADGSTFQAMQETLGLHGLSRDEINEAYRALLELLVELDPDVELAVANSVWHRDDLTPHPAFLQETEDYFGARIQGLDFSSPQAAGTINDWVREATRDRIKEIVDNPIDPQVVAILLNAVYFKAGWTDVFDPERTREEPFHLLDGSSEPAEFMIRDDTLRYYSADRYAAVDLPYAGQAFSMTVVVPHEGERIHDLVQELDPQEWDEIIQGLTTTRVQLWLPRFEVEWESSLNDPLSAMGMGEAFQPGANFSRMFQDASPWIDEVKQKSFIRVDEEGTEAAAVTSVVMATSMPPQLRADRPFLFAIRERLTGTILFMGLVVEMPRL
jgi:serine protease inhibitor